VAAGLRHPAAGVDPDPVTTGRRWRVVGAGAGLAALYAVVALVTGAVSPRPLLPLFDGFTPPTPYAWVKPPPERAGDNVAPKAAERQYPLTADGVAASNASTDDAQAIVGLDKGSVPAHPPDTGVTVKIDPVDAGTLGPLPAGLRAISNAYRVTITYTPSQTPVTTLGAKGTIALTAAEGGDRILFSADGKTWQDRAFKPYGQDNGVFADFDAVGWFVVATTAKGTASAKGGGSGALVVLLVVGGVGAVGAIGVVIGVWSRSKRKPAPRSGRRPAGARSKSGAKKPAKRRR